MCVVSSLAACVAARLGGCFLAPRTVWLACVGRLLFLVRVCLCWFPALGSDCLCMPNYCATGCLIIQRFCMQGVCPSTYHALTHLCSSTHPSRICARMWKKLCVKKLCEISVCEKLCEWAWYVLGHTPGKQHLHHLLPTCPAPLAS